MEVPARSSAEPPDVKLLYEQGDSFQTGGWTEQEEAEPGDLLIPHSIVLNNQMIWRTAGSNQLQTVVPRRVNLSLPPHTFIHSLSFQS